MNDLSILEDHAQYQILRSRDGEMLRFDWKEVRGLTAAAFAEGILAFAQRCRAEHPARAVIDARALDPGSEAVRWLRGQDDGSAEAYQPWWVREIVPRYHEAGIASLTVATGDPDAPGLVPMPDEIRFRVAYLTDLESAICWR